MGPGVSYNNKHILTGVLEQLMPQYGIEEKERRIFVGAQGGVHSPLFWLAGRREANLPNSLDVASLQCIGRAQEYFAHLQAYHRRAETVAQEHGFGIVTIDEDIVRGCALDDYIYRLGIGLTVVEEEQQLRELLSVVKDFGPEFQDFERRLDHIARAIRSR